MQPLTGIIPATLVYVLAHLRRGPYYIEVAPDLEAVEACVQALAAQRRLREGVVYDTLRLVWHEACETAAAAQARAAQIRAMPRPWQRRMIEAQNPDWVDQYFPLGNVPYGNGWYWYCVPETTPNARSQLETYNLPADRYERVRAQADRWLGTMRARTPP